MLLTHGCPLLVMLQKPSINGGRCMSSRPTTRRRATLAHSKSCYDRELTTAGGGDDTDAFGGGILDPCGNRYIPTGNKNPKPQLHATPVVSTAML